MPLRCFSPFTACFPGSCFPALGYSLVSNDVSVDESQSAGSGVDDNRLISVHAAAEQLFAQVVEHVALYCALYGACAKLRVEAGVGQPVDGRGGDF